MMMITTGIRVMHWQPRRLAGSRRHCLLVATVPNKASKPSPASAASPVVPVAEHRQW